MDFEGEVYVRYVLLMRAEAVAVAVIVSTVALSSEMCSCSMLSRLTVGVGGVCWILEYVMLWRWGCL